MASPEGLEFVGASNDAWAEANIRGGADAGHARAGAEQTLAFYTCPRARSRRRSRTARRPGARLRRPGRPGPSPNPGAAVRGRTDRRPVRGRHHGGARHLAAGGLAAPESVA